MTSILHLARRLRDDRRGVAAAEYAILAVGIVIVVGAALLTLLDPNQAAFTQVGTAMSSTQTSMATNLR